MRIIRKIAVLEMIIFIIFVSKVYAKDIILVLDPGHGGIDPGAQNLTAGIIEKDVNLKIARYLKEYLEPYAGIKVIQTHNGFTEGKMELLDRAMVGRNNNADMLISLHCNASDTSKQVKGAEAYVTKSTLLPKYNQKCSKLANLILNNLSKLGIENNGVKLRLSGDETEVYTDGTRGDYYGIIRYSMKGVFDGPGANIQNGEGMSAVLVEHCYIQNGDEKYISSDEAIKKIAKADGNAIVEYYKLRLKEKIVSAIELDKTRENLLTGDSMELKATVYPENAEDKAIKWTSSDEKVATVKDGKVTAIKPGEVTITATTNDGGYTSNCKVIVEDLNIKTSIDKINNLENDKLELIYEVEPYLPNNSELSIKIENEEIASIDENNFIQSKSTGETNLNIKVIEKDKKEALFEKQIPIKVNKLEENESIKIEEYKEENGIITKIKVGTTVSEFLSKIIISENLKVTTNKENSALVSSNTKITIQRKETDEIVKEYYCYVFGDVNGDGKISPADYVIIKKHIMKELKLNIVQNIIADIDRNGKISPADYVRVKNHIMKVRLIDEN